jgi:hypothetical protein
MLSRGLRPLEDLVAMVAPGLGAVAITYAARREAGHLVIAGSAAALRTRAVIALGAGAHQLEVERGGVKRVVELRPAPSNGVAAAGARAAAEAA